MTSNGLPAAALAPTSAEALLPPEASGFLAQGESVTFSADAPWQEIVPGNTDFPGQLVAAFNMTPGSPEGATPLWLVAVPEDQQATADRPHINAGYYLADLSNVRYGQTYEASHGFVALAEGESLVGRGDPAQGAHAITEGRIAIPPNKARYMSRKQMTITVPTGADSTITCTQVGQYKTQYVGRPIPEGAVEEGEVAGPATTAAVGRVATTGAVRSTVPDTRAEASSGALANGETLRQALQADAEMQGVALTWLRRRQSKAVETLWETHVAPRVSGMQENQRLREAQQLLDGVGGALAPFDQIRDAVGTLAYQLQGSGDAANFSAAIEQTVATVTASYHRMTERFATPKDREKIRAALSTVRAELGLSDLAEDPGIAVVRPPVDRHAVEDLASADDRRPAEVRERNAALLEEMAADLRTRGGSLDELRTAIIEQTPDTSSRRTVITQLEQLAHATSERSLHDLLAIAEEAVGSNGLLGQMRRMLDGYSFTQQSVDTLQQGVSSMSQLVDRIRLENSVMQTLANA